MAEIVVRSTRAALDRPVCEYIYLHLFRLRKTESMAPGLPMDYSDEDLLDGAGIDDVVVDEGAPRRAASKRTTPEAKVTYNEAVLHELQHEIHSAEHVSDETSMLHWRGWRPC